MSFSKKENNTENLPEKSQSGFNYSQLTGNEADKLRDCENVIKNESENYFTLIGKTFREAQEVLSAHHGGVFEQWYTALGFKKQTVYNLMQRYDYLSRPTIGKQEKEAFEKLPLTLSYEVSAPSAPKELVKQVISGKIKTNAEYRKQKKELKSKAEKSETLRESLDNELSPEEEYDIHSSMERVSMNNLINFLIKNPSYKSKVRKLITPLLNILESEDEE